MGYLIVLVWYLVLGMIGLGRKSCELVKTGYEGIKLHYLTKTLNRV